MGGAEIQGDYRWSLWREFDKGKGRVCFVMLNPSDATAVDDDPTIRKCKYYAQAWGFRRLDVVNLFAYQTPYPKELLTCEFPIGGMNNQTITNVARNCEMVVCAWGRLHRKLAHRQPQVMRLLKDRARGVMCLGLNNDLSPKHPLYMRNDKQPQQWVANGLSSRQPEEE